MKFLAARDIPITENSTGKVIPMGTVLYVCDKATYGVITPTGIALGLTEHEYPFFEVTWTKENLTEIQ